MNAAAAADHVMIGAAGAATLVNAGADAEYEAAGLVAVSLTRTAAFAADQAQTALVAWTTWLACGVDADHDATPVVAASVTRTLAFAAIHDAESVAVVAATVVPLGGGYNDAYGFECVFRYGRPGARITVHKLNCRISAGVGGLSTYCWT